MQRSTLARARTRPEGKAPVTERRNICSLKAHMIEGVARGQGFDRYELGAFEIENAGAMREIQLHATCPRPTERVEYEECSGGGLYLVCQCRETSQQHVINLSLHVDCA